MIYRSFCSRVPPHPRHLWLLRKFDSLNSIETLLLTNTQILSLIPRIFDMTSFLVSISLTNAAAHSTMKITKSNGWNTLFLSAMTQNSSPLIITPQSCHHLTLILKMTLLATQLLMLLQRASLMINTNRPTAMMFPSTNIVFCSISIVIFSTSLI